MLSVVLGRTTQVYGPGELLTGDAVIKTTAYCRILDLTVNFCGVSVVSFVIPVDNGNSRVYKKVQETDIHLDVLHPLIKCYRGIAIEAGIHTYRFCMKLPFLLPSSYSSQYGHVEYYIQIHLQTSSGVQDVQKHFVVKAPVDIRLFTASLNPQCAQVTKKYGLVGHKTMRLKASLFKTCFVPGDVISVFVEVRNETHKELRYLFCTLKKITTSLIHLQDKTVDRVTKHCVMTTAHKIGDHKGYYSWHCPLVSPTTLTPTIAASSVVFVTYAIQVSAKLKRVPIPPAVEIPIVFGTRAPVLSQRTRGVSESSAAILTTQEDSLLPSIHKPLLRHTNCPQPIIPNLSPPITNPRRRRRVTVSTQPQLLLTNTTKRVSNHLQTFATNLSQKLNIQLQSGLVKPLKTNNSCLSQPYEKV